MHVGLRYIIITVIIKLLSSLKRKVNPICEVLKSCAEILIAWYHVLGERVQLRERKSRRSSERP